MFDLTAHPNKRVSKCLATLLVLDQEIQLIRDRVYARYFDEILVFGEQYSERPTVLPGEWPVTIGTLLPLIAELHELVKRLNKVIFNLVG